MIIVAGGSGSRMGAGIPKQFLELDGRPILMHTLENLHEMDGAMELILVLPEEEMDNWEQLCYKHEWQLPHKLVNGGSTRFLSVKNGLNEVKNAELVGVHDGVRPFVSSEVVKSCFKAASENGAAVPVVAIVQSLRMVEEGGSSAVDRSAFRAVQTPQSFKSEVLKNAFGKAERIDYSDDASVVEAAGDEIILVDGNPENIKITTPIDLELAQLIIDRQSI